MEALVEILRDLHPEVEVEGAEGLIEDGILDSFDIVTLVAEIDEAYGVAIPAEELTPENFDSVRALYGLILRLRER